MRADPATTDMFYGAKSASVRDPFGDFTSNEWPSGLKSQGSMKSEAGVPLDQLLQGYSNS
jgi:hypothetical protein